MNEEETCEWQPGRKEQQRVRRRAPRQHQALHGRPEAGDGPAGENDRQPTSADEEIQQFTGHARRRLSGANVLFTPLAHVDLGFVKLSPKYP